ncbi:MAG: hypothetical protein PUE03_06855 [Prevotella sp.]|nr:hypothetical protein [Prevotella sp.]
MAPSDSVCSGRLVPVPSDRYERYHASAPRGTNSPLQWYHRSDILNYGYIKHGKGYIEYETDSDLRDIEKIAVKEEIYEYFQREVRPYVADAWINLPVTKIGCEISFNKDFYKPAPLRSFAENEADILALDEKSQGFIKSLFELI